MNDDNLIAHDVFSYMNERNVVLSFLGDFTHDVVTTLLSSVKQILNSMDADYKVKKKIYNVAVECLDNISKHNIGAEYIKEANISSSTIFTVSTHDDHFEMMTGNYISNDEIPDLAARFEKVNSLDKTGLQELYSHYVRSQKMGNGR